MACNRQDCSKGRLPLAHRLGNLGTETAYRVAADAAALKAKGKTIYPFHIGDLNFKTPQCVCDAAKRAMDEGKTGYCAAGGIEELRRALAETQGRLRNVHYGPENVSIQPGGKPVIGKFLQCVMEEGDEVLYPSPGYPIYESMINFLGGKAVPYTYIETSSGFEMDMKRFRKLITPKTRVLIYNNFQNPMGVCSSKAEMQEIAQLCVRHNLWVLTDEPYLDIRFGDAAKESIVTLPGMQQRSVILFTFSKSWAMTGWRLGAAIGPQHIIDAITKLNTNAEACTTHFVQFAGVEALKNPESAAFTENMVSELRRRRDVLVECVNKVPGFHCHVPKSTFYLFVNVTKAMRWMKMADIEQFRLKVLRDTGVSFCTREHFGARLPFEKEYYVRFAFSGINQAQIKEGLTVLRKYMRKVQQESGEAPMNARL